MNRVVITGYGGTSPIGNEPETFLESLKTGKMVSDRLVNLMLVKQVSP